MGNNETKLTIEPETDPDEIGLIVARHFEWDGLQILKAFSSALEDANFHTENETVSRLIERVEKDFPVFNRV